MPNVERIDIIVHPLYTLPWREEETLAAVGNTQRLARRIGPRRTSVFIIEPGGKWHMPETLHAVHDRHYGRLVGTLRKWCRNLYEMGEDDTNHYHGAFMQRWERFLRRRGLTLGKDIMLVGHGTFKEYCVSETLYLLRSKLMERAGVNPKYRFGGATCVSDYPQG